MSSQVIHKILGRSTSAERARTAPAEAVVNSRRVIFDIDSSFLLWEQAAQDA